MLRSDVFPQAVDSASTGGTLIPEIQHLVHAQFKRPQRRWSAILAVLRREEAKPKANALEGRHVVRFH
jgi:hypothetical protein